MREGYIKAEMGRQELWECQLFTSLADCFQQGKNKDFISDTWTSTASRARCCIAIVYVWLIFHIYVTSSTPVMYVMKLSKGVYLIIHRHFVLVHCAGKLNESVHVLPLQCNNTERQNIREATRGLGLPS